MRTYETEKFKYMFKRGDTLYYRYEFCDDDRLSEDFRMYRSIKKSKNSFDLKRVATFKDGVSIPVAEPEFSMPEDSVHGHLYNTLDYYYIEEVDVFESKEEMERYIALDQISGIDKKEYL